MTPPQTRWARAVGLVRAATGAAVVLAQPIDVAAAPVPDLSAGASGPDLRLGGWPYLLLLPVTAASVVLALTGVGRRDR